MSHNAKAWKLKRAPFNTKRRRTLSSLNVVKRQVPEGVVYLIKLKPRNKWHFLKKVCLRHTNTKKTSPGGYSPIRA